MTTDNKIPFKLLTYDRWEVVSAWIKELRLGNKDNSLYWLFVMVEGGMPISYIVRRMFIFAFEDCIGRETVIYLSGVKESLSVTGNDDNILWRATCELCEAPKFWEAPRGRLEETICNDIEQEVKDQGYKRELPSYALDMHTRRGKQLSTQNKADLRFSGNEEGRLNMCEMYKKYNRLNPADKGVLIEYNEA